MTARLPSAPDAAPGAACSTLHAGTPATRFEGELEAEYIRMRLRNGRNLIRMTCLLGLVVAGLRVSELAATGGPKHFPFAGWTILFPGLVVAASVLLAWLAWSSPFERRYLPVANFLVPTRNVLAAIAIGAMAAKGHVELLMVLTAMVLSPFFFLGLQFRHALACVALTIVSFGISAFAFSLPVPVLLRSCAFLSLTAATSAVAAWQIERQSRRSFLDGRFIARLAEHDALTGAKNRRVFDEHLNRLWQQAIDERRRIAILLIDVDCFKAYNDRYGHQAGDAVLRRVVQTVQTQICQPLDLLSRYGGEEFAALLYDIDGRQARGIAEQMRLAVSALAIEHRGSSVARTVTVSIGVGAVQPRPEREPVGALQLADEALYAAKTGGRNRVHLASESDYSGLETGIFAQHAGGARNL